MRWFRLFAVILFLRPVLFVIAGSGIRGRERLPDGRGPAIVIANHNSHLDALVLLASLPWRAILRVRPIVAGDYFSHSWWGRWLVLGVMGGIPIARSRANPDDDPLAPAHAALMQGAVLIFFPEGTRGEPEVFGPVKKGLGHLVAGWPEVPVVPVWLKNLGRSWPRGASLPVPLACHGRVGRALYWTGSVDSFTAAVEKSLLKQARLVAEGEPKPYDFGDEAAE
jgi:1-acyl-sn-glycerol-3-phosphate acyltransferase